MRLALCFTLVLAAGPLGPAFGMVAPRDGRCPSAVDRDQSAPHPAGKAPLHASAPGKQSGGIDGSSPVPEPSTLLLVGTGIVGVALTTRLRRRRPQP